MGNLRLHLMGKCWHISGLTQWTKPGVCPVYTIVMRRSTAYVNLTFARRGMQAIYTLLGGTRLTLTEFIAIMGGAVMLFTQIPTFHSLWFINMLNMLNTYLFTAIAMIVAIFQTTKYDLPRDYGVHGSNADKAFGVFQGIVIMHFVYG